ncbi:MAG: DVUA0089 family protein [Telluria sp.]
MKKFLLSTAVAAALGGLAGTAAADDYNDHIAFHNDVLFYTFIVTQASQLTAWTDSYASGANFDPIVAVWHQGQLLAQNDDNPTVAPGQSYFDAGITGLDLQPGSYVFSIGAYANFARGPTLADGFIYDGQTPIPLSQWCEPATGCNPGPHVSLHWNLSPVPEPASFGMMSAGLAVVSATVARRRRRK